jgi:hypothetical protein
MPQPSGPSNADIARPAQNDATRTGETWTGETHHDSDAPAADETADRAADRAAQVARGVCRRLADLGYGTLTEFRVGQGRRVDVIGLDKDGRFAIVEIKTSLADFRADTKWPDYLPFCDLYYFAVPDGFPTDVLPEEHGLIVADAHDAAILREAPARPMNGTRRKGQILRFGLAASGRLQGLLDPRVGRRWAAL